MAAVQPVTLKRAIILVADGVGCGEAPDASAYGDQGANTLGNLAKALGGLHLPTLERLGLGNTTNILGVAPVADAQALHGQLIEASQGKDTITGHWEMAGIITRKAMPTYPKGFPREILDPLIAASGRGVLGNKTASGTAILDELGVEHMRAGALIVYTSADSVLQIAAHESVVPLPELYRICEAARKIADEHGIGRVIARPFVGQPGAWQRTYNRKDWPLLPPSTTLLDHVKAAGLPVVGVGKIHDIFAGQGLTESIHTEGNVDGMEQTLTVMKQVKQGLVFVNLVDFDMLYGHRNDCTGFQSALETFDRWLARFLALLQPGDLAFITADHGNDPTFPGTDHTRERVPLLAFGPQWRTGDLGNRSSFADLGQTIVSGLGAEPLANGRSFLDMMVR
ncbi:MAG: phosphopentomutase [Deltaproteobacteria bacterium]|nr:phosphopentomutase [Deltaproteobacteria bacterium]